jgi:hypothetical protein
VLTPFGFTAPLGACGPNKTLLEALQARRCISLFPP